MWEHLANPGEELELIVRRRPEVRLLSTELCKGQGGDWRYLWPNVGRHVFFYSPGAMRWLADKYGYRVLSGKANYTLFYRRPLSPLRRRLLEAALTGRHKRAGEMLYALARKSSLIEADRAWVMARVT